MCTTDDLCSVGKNLSFHFGKCVTCNSFALPATLMTSAACRRSRFVTIVMLWCSHDCDFSVYNTTSNCGCPQLILFISECMWECVHMWIICRLCWIDACQSFFLWLNAAICDFLQKDFYKTRGYYFSSFFKCTFFFPTFSSKVFNNFLRRVELH